MWAGGLYQCKHWDTSDTLRYSLKVDNYPKLPLLDRTGESGTVGARFCSTSCFGWCLTRLGRGGVLQPCTPQYSTWARLQDPSMTRVRRQVEERIFLLSRRSRKYPRISLPISVACQLSPPSGKGLLISVLISAFRSLRSRMPTSYSRSSSL